MKRSLMLVLLLALSVSFSGCGNRREENPPSDGEAGGDPVVMTESDVSATAKTDAKEETLKADPEEMNKLKEQYPEYFDLSASKGLEVYVWQMAPNSYSFGVLPGTNRNKTLEELWNLKGATAEEMRTILSSYDIDRNDIFIIPWQNPISSYLPEFWISGKDDDPDAALQRRQAYVDSIRTMLFPEPAPASGTP